MTVEGSDAKTLAKQRTEIACRLVRALREARGWSQKELAERSGMDATAVSKIENGGTGSLKLDTLLRLCAAMDYSPQEFFDELANFEDQMLAVIEQKGGEAGEQARQQREARNRDEDDNDIDDEDEDEDDASSTLGLNWNRLLEPAALGMAGVIGAAIALWVLRKDD